MSSNSDLQSLGKISRDLKKEFDLLVIPHRPALWRYCRAITGSAWDAEDLVQETLLRAFASLSQLWQPLVPKAYLFRIASNAWIDQCRKQRIEWEENVEPEQLSQPVSVDSLEVTEAMETLVANLPARQRVIFLLIDVFDFTAAEAASMIGSTEGAVKAALHRARVKLQERKGRQREEDVPMKVRQTWTESDKMIVQAYLDAFNRRDPDGIAELLDDQAAVDIVHIALEYGKETIRKYSLEGWAKDPMPMQAQLHDLWGELAVVVLTETAEGPAVYDLIRLELNHGRIVQTKEYYFCPELLAATAAVLGIGVHSNGYLYG